MELPDIKKITLAGFLHDVGKFRERAGKKVNDENSKYDPLHAAHTAEAIDEMQFYIDKKLKDELINLTASHHLKDIGGDAEIIKKANEYAGRLDREKKENEKFDLLRPLITPFSYIELKNKPRESYYPLQKLEGKIKSTYKKINNLQKEYEELYNEFIEEIKRQKLTFEKGEDFLILKSIFEKYTSFIPSATFEAYPDVSLFDHSLATAAIAVAIKKGDGENFSLIQGDFTSIQSFIFSKFGEKNKYLAKILRAKSFFVNIVTELVSLKIVRALELSPFNIVMNAGGKFTILTHKLTDEDKNKLDGIKKWVNKEFENINFLQTKFIIETEDFTEDEFSLGKFSNVFKRLAYKFEKAKLEFIPSKNVFENYIENAKNGLCEICGIVPLEAEKENDEKICKYCTKFKNIGEKLPNGAYVGFNLDNILSIEIVTSDKNKEKIEKKLEEFDFYFGLKDYPIKRIANYVPVFSKEDLKSGRYELIKEKFDEKDIKEGKIKSFYHIAVDGLKKEKDKWAGKSYLAILKADIDNLGEIFIRGFKNTATFSRVLYLSRMIDYFFTNELMCYVNGKNIYTVFAGGDDLFLIGHYEDIVKTYRWILSRFKKYTKNKDFHLSAAIKFTRPSIPINLMAEYAEEDLEKSKSFLRGDEKNKNAVTIFDITVANEEFSKLVKEKKFFENMYKKLQEVNSGTSFLYKFYTFIDMNERLKEDEKDMENVLQNVRWKYMLRYLAEKNFEEKKNDDKKEIKKELKKDITKIGEMIEKDGKKLIIPLNLFLYSIRTN